MPPAREPWHVSAACITLQHGGRKLAPMLQLWPPVTCVQGGAQLQPACSSLLSSLPYFSAGDVVVEDDVIAQLETDKVLPGLGSSGTAVGRGLHAYGVAHSWYAPEPGQSVQHRPVG